MQKLIRWSLVLGGWFFASAMMEAKTFRVTVAAAGVDRAAQVVKVTLPPEARGLNVLADARGGMLPLQIEADGTARFIVPAQKAGEVLTFTLSEAKMKMGPGIEVQRDPGQLHFTLNGAGLFDYQMDKEAVPRADIPAVHRRAGYLHPIYTPKGTIVSDDYPPQHIHHHGIWAPWTKATFQGRDVDFWNTGANKGIVEFVALDRTWSGVVHGGFVAKHRFLDRSAPTPLAALNETWQVTAYALPGTTARVFDLELTQTCATADPLILPKYHYGGLGYRGLGEWLGADKTNFLTSEGTTDRVKADEQKMRWVHLSGAVADGVAGLAVLGHPGNFRAPQPVRVHPKEPYVSFTPSWEGDWKIEPGKPYVARYRFVVADGPADRAQLDAFWNGYALPAAAKVEELP
ncbi:MAG: PmoA family protein [Opitutaceae bacterium]